MGQTPLRKASPVSSAPRTKLRRREMSTTTGRENCLGPLTIGSRSSIGACAGLRVTPKIVPEKSDARARRPNVRLACAAQWSVANGCLDPS